MKTKSLTFIGTALALAMSGTAVHAQTGQPASQEIRMSPEGMQILCKNFPMNSRCAGNSTTNSQSKPQASEAAPTPSSSEPSEAAPAPSSSSEPSEMTPAPSGSEPSEMTPAPSGSGAEPRM